MNSANPLAAFAPLIGQLVWAVSKGYDTFVTMEFGAPHLLVREPRAPRRNTSPRLERTAARRSAIVKGDWHLFIEFAEWRMTSANGSIGSKDKKRVSWQAVLADISGQRLIAAESPTPGSLTLRFDLGGVAEIWPHPKLITTSGRCIPGWETSLAVVTTELSRREGKGSFRDRDHRRPS